MEAYARVNADGAERKTEMNTGMLWYEEDDDYDEEREQAQEDERRAECWCGAFQWNGTQFVQVADCVCVGAY